MEGCDRIRGRLPAYVLGEAEEADRAAVAGHLAACEACRREEARVAGVIAALRAMPELPSSAMRKERALAAARAAVERPRRGRVAWVAAVAAIALVAFALRQTTRRTEPYLLTVEKVEGTVERQEAGGWVVVKVGAPLAEGGRLRTAAGRATLKSSRGDRIVLDADSEFVVGATTEAEEGILLQTGRLWCEAQKRTGRRLVIRTPAGRVEVVGTKFEVTYR